jgi:hypothetical protein
MNLNGRNLRASIPIPQPIDIRVRRYPLYVFLGALLVFIAADVCAQEQGSEIKSRTMGKPLRLVQKACKTNLEQYCAAKSAIPANVSYRATQKEDQFDVRCAAICKVKTVSPAQQ